MGTEYQQLNGRPEGFHAFVCEGCGCILGKDARYRGRHAEVCPGRGLPDATAPTEPARDLPPVIVTSSRYSPSDL